MGYSPGSQDKGALGPRFYVTALEAFRKTQASQPADFILAFTNSGLQRPE